MNFYPKFRIFVLLALLMPCTPSKATWSSNFRDGAIGVAVLTGAGAVVGAYLYAKEYFEGHKKHTSQVGNVVIERITDLAWYDSIKTIYDTTLESWKNELRIAPKTNEVLQQKLSDNITLLIEKTREFAELVTRYTATARILATKKTSAGERGTTIDPLEEAQFCIILKNIDLQISTNMVEVYTLMGRELPTETVIFRDTLKQQGFSLWQRIHFAWSGKIPTTAVTHSTSVARRTPAPALPAASSSTAHTSTSCSAATKTYVRQDDTNPLRF